MLDPKNKNNFLKKVLIIAAVAISLYLTWQLSDIIVLIVTAIMMAVTLKPFVVWFEKRLHSRKAASALVTVMMVLPVIFVLVIIIPVFVSQIDKIALTITSLLNSNHYLPGILRNIDFSQYTKEAGQYLWLSTKAVTNFIAQLTILIFMIYYLLIDAESLYNLFAHLIPSKIDRKKIDYTLSELGEISGHYIRGNLLISFFCFSIMLVGLLILHVPGAVALSVFAGITDLLPLVGATIGSIPAIILGFTVSPATGILTVILFWAYQQFENDIIIPRVYRKALKIIPFLSFISVIIGTLLFGIAGAFLSLPIAAGIPTVVHYFSHNNKISSK